MFFQIIGTLKVGATAPFELKLNSAPNSCVFHSFTGIFHRHHGPYHFVCNRARSPPNEEALIDRDSDVFDTEITISPVSVSRANLSDNVGRQIPFLEAVQASIVPYVVEVAFPFPEFIGWCAETILTGREGVLNKLGSEVLCRVDSPSIRYALGIPESPSAVSEPFEEENLVMVYRECPPEVKNLFLQTIVKPEHYSESLSLPMNVNVMVIEIQWACSILSQILGLDNENM
jgi:hypothetical protein